MEIKIQSKIPSKIIETKKKLEKKLEEHVETLSEFEIEISKYNDNDNDNDYQNSVFFTIKTQLSKELIIKINHIDYILISVCLVLFDNFSYISDKEKYKLIKDLKYKMSIDLDKEDLYDKYNYRHKRFKKIDLQNSLIENNKVLHKFFYKYLADYFQINIIEIINRKIKYITNYNKSRYSLIIYNNKNNFYVKYQNNLKCLKNHEFITTEFKIEKSIGKKKNIKTLKLPELQKLAISKGIDIKKLGKKGKINKTKSQLIDEIGLN